MSNLQRLLELAGVKAKGDTAPKLDPVPEINPEVQSHEVAVDPKTGFPGVKDEKSIKKSETAVSNNKVPSPKSSVKENFGSDCGTGGMDAEGSEAPFASELQPFMEQFATVVDGMASTLKASKGMEDTEARKVALDAIKQYISSMEAPKDDLDPNAPKATEPAPASFM